jgi:UDP-glucose 4-epimerase
MSQAQRPAETVLVTGGAGFIGSHLVQHLRRRRPEWKVRVLDNLSTGKAETLHHLALDSMVEPVVGDILDESTLADAMRDVTRVFHLAANASVPRSIEHPVESLRVMVEGTLKVLEAARRAGAHRVVYAASSSAYGDSMEPIKDESLRPMPRSPYAAAKLAGEHLMSAWHTCHGITTVSLRFFNVFGPRQDPASPYAAVIPRFIARMMRGEAPLIEGDGHQTRDFTYVENNAHACLLAAEAPEEAVAGRVFNIACGQAISLLQLVAILNEVLDTRIEAVHVAPRPGDVRHSLASIQAAREALRYHVHVDFLEGIRRTVAYHQRDSPRAV